MNFTLEKNRIYAKNQEGDVIAEVSFPAVNDNVVNISHTFVDKSLRGQGIAGKMMQQVADYLKKEKKEALLTCSYAKKWFDDNADYEEVVFKL